MCAAPVRSSGPRSDVVLSGALGPFATHSALSATSLFQDAFILTGFIVRDRLFT